VNPSVIEPKEVFQFRKVGESVFEWKVPGDLPYFNGHFPSNPILPGIAMIDASLEVVRYALSLESAPFIKKLHSAKFTGLVRPDDTVEFTLEDRDGKKRVSMKKEGVQTAEIIFEI
jgi:3-hydroxymyristoyl/3-hydroxydecanoyl-(acyl carrier protein) dehydratase